MADGKLFINTVTGEVVASRIKLGAYLYFKRDGKHCGYKVTRKDIMPLATFLELGEWQTEFIK